MERLELVVIGAGWYGLGAAKQYHCQHANHSMAIVDSASSIGGVWANHRLYPGLKSNNLLGTFEYPDFPMSPDRFGVQPGQHIPGQVVHDYQEAYAKHFGISSLVRLNTRVVSAEHQAEGGWILQLRHADDSDGRHATTSSLFTRRLIVATGMVSEPFMPNIAGQEEYGRPLFHAKDFLQHADTIDPEKRVTIFGGTKFAWDAVYAYATKGVKVDWVIRPSGHGPCWMSPPIVTPFKKWIEELVNMRMLHWFAPCIWAQDSGYQWIKSFWHGTAVGRAIVNAFFGILGDDVLQLVGFDKHPETRKLKPICDPMFTGATFSIMNYDTDFFAPIRDGTVKVHIADLDHLSAGKVHLADEAGTVLDSDAMMCVTGWKYVAPVKFLPEGIERKIGISHRPSEDKESLSPDEGLSSQKNLIEKADAEILARFPRLKTPPKFNPNYVPLLQTKAFSLPEGDVTASSGKMTPMMLYHFMVPGTAEFLRTKDIAFAGAIMNFSNIICSHVQGLWISSYFDGTLARDPSAAVTAEQPAVAPGKPLESLTLDRVHYETVLHNRFGRWRYPNDAGRSYPDFVFEAVPYLDMMMADLGLAVHRKKGWLKEISEPYRPGDYGNINEEWNAKFGSHST